ncbi:hypothetical protein B0H11DRAFT_2214599 [Mycena galericulata]|nr:hypothetical protein B0H11DRAFT_2214599 [Mycena galericulata]
MKTAIFFSALSLVISAVEALPRDSNAQRLARGLPPLPPQRRQPGFKRSTPSSTPFHCDTKKTLCCSGFESASSPAAKNILSGLSIPTTSCGEQIGTGCVAASSDGTCTSGKPAKCCGNIVGSALVGVDCTPSDCSFYFLIIPPNILGLDPCELQLCLAEQLRIDPSLVVGLFEQFARIIIRLALEQLRLACKQLRFGVVGFGTPLVEQRAFEQFCVACKQLRFRVVGFVAPLVQQRTLLFVCLPGK